MTKIHCYCEECHTWQEVTAIDISVNVVILHLNCGHRMHIFGLFKGDGVVFL